VSRRGLIIASALAVAAAVALAALPRGGEGLAVRAPDGSLHRWWRSDRAPRQWDGRSTPLAAAVAWRRGSAGLEWGEVEISGAGEASALRLVVARLDPARFDLSLVLRLDHPDSWSLDAAPPEAALAVNAGMFVAALPWGWLVLEGKERLAPGVGPLSSAVVVRRDGTVGWVDGDDVSAWRGNPNVRFAFQSYPTLLVGDGEVPATLQSGDAVNLNHRDARLALGIDREGKLLLALTRFDAPLPAADRIPFGVTLPEMAAVMGALGARQAVSLDGGISAQLMLRDVKGEAHRWPGLRRVPLALVATPRE
jgi:uncharacterized protein YigE (DUF2233 family)